VKDPDAAKFITERVSALLQVIEAEFHDEVLDLLVHDSASEQASAVNNNGQAAQVEYLLTNGWTAEDILGRLRIQEEEDEA
jgi:hypothetical protein